MIVGLTGTAGSGKDTVADYLKEKGFIYHSCSDIIREECTKLGKETNRDNLIELGNKMRAEEGFGTLAIRILKKIKENNEKNSLVVSIRHPNEVTELKKDPTFKLIFITAPLEIRFQRTQKRTGRAEDNVNFEKFKEQEQKENQTSGAGQQLSIVSQMADTTLVNDGTLEDFHKKMEEVFKHVR